MSILFVFSLFLFLLRLWLSSFGGIHPDEAYYWGWAQELRLGYFDHPPMIAWIIALGEKLFSFFLSQDQFTSDSTQQMAFRFVPYFLTTLAAPMFLGAFIKRSQRHDLTFTQVTCLLCTPLFLIGPQIITPDAPLFFGWAWCLYLYKKIYTLRGAYAQPGDPTPFSLKYSIWMGVALAFCAYSKYTAILIFFFLIITGGGLLNCLASGLVALILTTPYFFWNVFEGKELGAGFFFQMKNAINTHSTAPQWNRVGDLFGAQILLWGIPSFLTAIYIAMRHPLRNIRYIVWAFGPLLFFSIGALRRPAEANWPLMGALAAYLMIIIRLHRKPGWMFWISAGNILSIVLAGVVLLNGSFLAPFVEKYSPSIAAKLMKPSRLQEFRGWKRFREFLFEATNENQNKILVDRYQLLSTLLFYDAVVPNAEKLGSRLKIWKNGGSRKSQFDIEARFDFDRKNPYWILLEDIRKAPDHCRLSQPLFREEAPGKSYFVLECQALKS